jgi:hypothetical protein
MSIRVKLTKRQQVVATITHEKGHHAHVVYGTSEKAMAAGLADLAGAITHTPREFGKGRIETERIAWKIAKRYKGKEWTPIMGWRGRWAFGTYLKGAGLLTGH